MCPTRAQSGRQSSKLNSGAISLVLYRGRQAGPAHPALWTGRAWGIVPSTLSLAHTSVPKGIIVTARCCPLRVNTMVPCTRSKCRCLCPPMPLRTAPCVPQCLCERLPCSALHRSPHMPFAYKHPSLFKV